MANSYSANEDSSSKYRSEYRDGPPGKILARRAAEEAAKDAATKEAGELNKLLQNISTNIANKYNEETIQTNEKLIVADLKIGTPEFKLSESYKKYVQSMFAYATATANTLPLFPPQFVNVQQRFVAIYKILRTILHDYTKLNLSIADYLTDEEYSLLDEHSTNINYSNINSEPGNIQTYIFDKYTNLVKLLDEYIVTTKDLIKTVRGKIYDQQLYLLTSAIKPQSAKPEEPKEDTENPYGGSKLHKRRANGQRGGVKRRGGNSGDGGEYVKLATSLHIMAAAFASVSPKLHAKLLRDPDYQFLENNLHEATFKNLCVASPGLRQKFYNTVYYKMLDAKEQAVCSASVSSEAIGVMNYYILEEQLGKKYSKAFDKAMMEYNGAGSDMTGGFFVALPTVTTASAAHTAQVVGSTAAQAAVAYGPVVGKTAEAAAMALYTKVIIPHTLIVLAVVAALYLWEKYKNNRTSNALQTLGVKSAGGGNIATSCIYLQQLTGMTPSKVGVMTDIMKNSKTVMWDCYYAMLKMIRKRKLKTDCENLDAAIKWAEVMPHDYLAKKLIAHRTATGCQ